jgi:hypothetical protein
MMNEKEAIERRIQVVQAFRKTHPNPSDTLSEDELDRLAPGTAKVLLHGKMDKERCASLRSADPKWSRRVLMQERYKAINNGVLGVCHEKGRFKATFEDRRIGTFGSAVEAAEAYNRAARRKYGDQAVLCEIEAAKKLDRRFANLSR